MRYAVLVLLMTLSLMGGAMGALTQKTVIQDPLHMAPTAANNTGVPTTVHQNLDNPGPNNERPLNCNTPYFTGGGAASGFKWGGYNPVTYNTAAPAQYGIRMADNMGGPPAGAVGNILTWSYASGQYFYTLFDSACGNNPNQYVDLSGAKASFDFWWAKSNTADTAPYNTANFKMRAMLRTNSGEQWYISEAFAVPSVTATYVNVVVAVNALKWYAIDSAVNTNLNLLAPNDEVPVTYATSVATPDFRKVDGGGIWMFDVTDTNGVTVTETTIIGHVARRIALPAWKAVNAAASPNLKVVCAPSYAKDTAALVLTAPSQVSGTITLGSQNVNLLVTVTNVALNDPAHEFTLSGLPSGTFTLDGSQVATITWTPSVADNKESSASLRLTCNVGYVPGTIVDIPIRGRDVISGTIYESFVDPTSTNMARNKTGFPNETPVILNPPTKGVGSSGFVWGAFSVATTDKNAAGTVETRDMVGMYSNSLTFYPTTTNDQNASGCWKGSYGYGLFDTMGGKGGSPAALYIDRTINLNRFMIQCNYIPAGCKIRWMIRDYTGQWYLSKVVTSVLPSWFNAWNFIDLSTLLWYRVDTAAENYMNGIVGRLTTTGPTVPIADLSTLTSAVPDTTKVTGTGIYIEQGNTTIDNVPLIVSDLNLIAAATSGETLTTSQTTVKDVLPVPNRRVALTGLSISAQGLESALTGFDVVISPSTSGVRSLILMSDPNGNGLPDDGSELTQCTLDSTGTLAHLTFRTTQYITQLSSPQKYSLVAVFDDTASSKTYSFSISQAGWKKDTDLGGNDTIVNTPNPIAASVNVASLNFPDYSKLHESTCLKETWEGVAASTIPNTATGSISGGDNAWTFTRVNFGIGVNALVPAQFAVKNSSMALCNEIKDMPEELNFVQGLQYNSSLMFLNTFNEMNTNVIKVAFDLAITSTTSGGANGHYSSRAVAENANFQVRLAAANNSDAYTFTVYPLVDAWRYLFGINCASGGVNYMSQYSPGNILAYSNDPGTGNYKFTVWLSLYSDDATLVKIDMTQVESNKTLSWMTVVDGKIDNFKNLRLAYNAYPNYNVDNVEITAYSNRLNPVKRWTIFE